ncbi:MAG: AbrB/MazE/SpoVT family DNA-binding domain-containing protein [Robiginitomaculum sp.]|nr:AbrB/MazE/SpoVT family DNA-binding domain-containing protein [Robiginitomaculum sp.]
MTELKITTIGNSAGIVLPKSVMSKLRVQKGDKLFAVETPGGIELTPYDPDFVSQMQAAETIMRQDRDVLKKLAK